MLWFHKARVVGGAALMVRDKAKREMSCNGNRQARGDRRKRRKLAGLFLSAVAMYLIIGLTACGGSTTFTKTIRRGRRRALALSRC